MKTAFAHWENRIAPVFDTARRICVVESESGRIVRQTQETLPAELPVRKALRLMDLGIGVLVCGAISRPIHGLVAGLRGSGVVPRSWRAICRRSSAPGWAARWSAAPLPCRAVSDERAGGSEEEMRMIRRNMP